MVPPNAPAGIVVPVRLLLAGIVVLVAVEVLQILARVQAGRTAAARTVPFERFRSGASRRVLIVGDSTAVGVAVQDPRESVAGRLGEEFPDAHLENKGRLGARTRDVLTVLRDVRDARYDLVLIQVGGNDVLRFTPLDDLRADIDAALFEAGRLSDRVVLLTAGNIGLAPFFPRPVGWLYTWRTQRVRALFRETAQRHGARYVDLFTSRRDDVFLTDPPRYYAPDFLHLSGEGYRVWYERVREHVRAARF